MSEMSRFGSSAIIEYLTWNPTAIPLRTYPKKTPETDNLFRAYIKRTQPEKEDFYFVIPTFTKTQRDWVKQDNKRSLTVSLPKTNNFYYDSFSSYTPETPILPFGFLRARKTWLQPLLYTSTGVTTSRIGTSAPAAKISRIEITKTSPIPFCSGLGADASLTRIYGDLVKPFLTSGSVTIGGSNLGAPSIAVENSALTYTVKQIFNTPSGVSPGVLVTIRAKNQFERSALAVLLSTLWIPTVRLSGWSLSGCSIYQSTSLKVVGELGPSISTKTGQLCP